MTQPTSLCQSLGMHLRGGAELLALVHPALRRNPRRAHLLVSTVLGKHIPADPLSVRDAADRLADLVALRLGADTADGTTEPCVVFGFAETATGLGHCVAARLGARVYLQSTRRPGAVVHGEFTEGHSHATSHLLQPSSPDLLGAADTLVLVDDEISTGATALDSIRALRELVPHRRYLVASLVDLRSDLQRAAVAQQACEAGIDVEFVALATGTVEVPAELPQRVGDVASTPLNPVGARVGSAEFVCAPWPPDVPDGGRHGVLASEQQHIRAAADGVAEAIASQLDERPLIVIGHEELMYLPLCVAESLARHGRRVRFQTTTRSPALVRDEDGYPLRRGFEFLAPEDDPDAPLRYLYNATWPDQPGARIVFIVDSPADSDRLRAPGGLLDVLTAAGADVLVVVVPAPSQARLAATREAGARQGAAEAVGP